jgi:hypothetical protein
MMGEYRAAGRAWAASGLAKGDDQKSKFIFNKAPRTIYRWCHRGRAATRDRGVERGRMAARWAATG